MIHYNYLVGDTLMTSASLISHEISNEVFIGTEGQGQPPLQINLKKV